MKCNNKHCQSNAICIPKMNIPAHGLAISRNTMKVLIDIPLCDKHFHEVRNDPQQFLKEGSDLVRVVEENLDGLGPRNYADAFITRATFDDPEFRQFDARMTALKAKAKPKIITE